ncbi:YihY family inner membrane protein [Xylophilus sp. GOD-11R]|uniref:YihY family inner membrane protein n=1 Tax=Xylophilus sp. GOD-11R TaxID=3089814 RepID=UPI00298BC9BE|nr:YihY family inner membrane protein [Xylophilus sp. GOD-11R]WPB55957.1 YihY family inner membrane protein [Xylophilus sp. GOD-11R]
MSLPPLQAPSRALLSEQRLRALAARWRRRARALATDLAAFPWRRAAGLLRERFRDDQLALTAGSLTFTTILALVPFFVVALALFTAFPMFGKMQEQLQRWLVASLVPEGIARQVLGYLTQFASKASRLGAAGLSALVITALALILTIDRTLNRIWRVRRPRGLAQRLLIYWAAITFGPLLLALSLATTASVITFSREVVGAVPGTLKLMLNSVEFLLLAGGIAGLYHFVPNTRVRWVHAWCGGVAAAAALEIAKKAVGVYIGAVPTYSVMYGAFASMPILLLWIYVAWSIVLMGAVGVAYLPSLLAGAVRRTGGAGWSFQLALEVLAHLRAAQRAGMHGRHPVEIAQTLQVDALQIEPVIEALVELDWIGELREARDGEPARLVLLVDMAATPVAPLAERLLLERNAGTRPVWERTGMAGLRLADVI